jgi:hypothetical protein
MKLPARYQDSICKGGYLHDFKPVVITNIGFMERCTRCGEQIHFPIDTPNWKYLSYHIRSILRADDQLYNHEYPNNR